MAKKKTKISQNDQGSLGSSLGAALLAKGFETSPSAVNKPSDTREQPEPLALDQIKKLVVQKERKGRGGKTVTVVSGLQLKGPALKSLARDLGKALGTGVKIEEETLVVQGGQGDRVKDWFLAKGVKRVVTSGQ